MNRGRVLAGLSLALLLLCCCTPARAGAVNACADGGRKRPDEGGIGGTGERPASPDNDDSGIGGTGARPVSPDEDDSGIGGTGIASGASSGLIGTITGFASICVGDVEIHYDAQTPVRIDGESAAASDLAVGQVVEVVASGAGSERTAREIVVHHIVSGPVTAVDAESNEISVIGQRVRLSAAAGLATAFAPDTFVQVGGLRRGDGVIVATRVIPVEGRDLVRITGPVSDASTSGLSIAGTEVQVADGRRVVNGDEVRVVGRWNGDAIRAQSVEALARVPFDGRVARVEIEGYARESSDGQLHVGAFPIELQGASAALRQSFESDGRIRVEAEVRDRHVIVERVEVMNGPPDRPPRPDNDGHPHKDGGFDDHGHGSEPPPFDQSRMGPVDGVPPPPREDGSMPPPRPEARGVDAPDHPAHPDGAMPPDLGQPPAQADLPQRPAPPPDRPDSARPERPDRPDVSRPDVPPRPDVPSRPDRPPPPPDRPQRIDRPQLPARP